MDTDKDGLYSTCLAVSETCAHGIVAGLDRSLNSLFGKFPGVVCLT